MVYRNDYDIPNSNFTFNEKQIEGILNCFTNNFVINCGKAGSGKTSTIIKPIQFLVQYGYNINYLFLSPTGKACNRLNEELKRIGDGTSKAYTIHKFNCYFRDNEDVDYNIDAFDNILEWNHTKKIKVIIIDEFSMVDLKTFYNFINKIKKLSHIVLIILGDYNQLPSISAGDLLTKLFTSKYFTNTYLDKVVRSDTSVITASDNILNNQPILKNINDNDFTINDMDPEKEYSKILDIV
jgi:exodeoxyribonuclease V alpha subunit